MKRAPFATAADYEVCRRIHRKFGSTYYFSTLRFPKDVRNRVHALYAFVRVPDEWVDNPGDLSETRRLELLDDWRRQLILGLEGLRPERPEMRAFCDTVEQCDIPLEEAELFLSAMRQDVSQTTYETYADLQGYMRGSASAVGVMMCAAMGVRMDSATLAQAKALGEAMQLTNFLRDVGEDYALRQRIYLPIEDLERFGVCPSELSATSPSARLVELLKFEIERARDLYGQADPGIVKLSDDMRSAVLLSRVLYAKILDKIEASGYDVLRQRVRTSRTEKLAAALRILIDETRVVRSLSKRDLNYES